MPINMLELLRDMDVDMEEVLQVFAATDDMPALLTLSGFLEASTELENVYWITPQGLLAAVTLLTHAIFAVDHAGQSAWLLAKNPAMKTVFDDLPEEITEAVAEEVVALTDVVLTLGKLWRYWIGPPADSGFTPFVPPAAEDDDTEPEPRPTEPGEEPEPYLPQEGLMGTLGGDE